MINERLRISTPVGLFLAATLGFAPAPSALAAALPAKPATTLFVPSDRTAGADPGDCSPEGLCLAVTTTAFNGDGTPCGTSSSAQVDAGANVLFCYTLTNGSTSDLNYHSLRDDASGVIFADLPYHLAQGESLLYRRVAAVRGSQLARATWTSREAQAGYRWETTVGDGDTDVLLRDGFDGAVAGDGYLDAIGGGELLVPPQQISLPFPVSFYGQGYDSAIVDAVGSVRFDTRFLYASPSPLPNPDMGPALLAWFSNYIFWSVPAEGTAVWAYTRTFGEAPNRRFAIEWDQLSTRSQAPLVGWTFEIVFTEGSDVIDFNYLTTGGVDPQLDGGLKAVVGLNRDGSLANVYSDYEARLRDGLRIRWTPIADSPDVSTASSSRIDVRAPTLLLSPSELAATVTSGGNASAPLTLANAGTADLAYSFGAPAAGAVPDVSPAAIAPPQPGVPAFAVSLFSGGLASGDASDPPSFAERLTLPVQAWAGDFVGNDFDHLYVINSPDVLQRIDVATGAVDVIGNTGLYGQTFPGPTGSAYDPVSGDLYTVGVDSEIPGHNFIYRTDPVTAVSAVLAEYVLGDGEGGDVVLDLAVDRAGHLFGIDRAGTLLGIDTATGAKTRIGPTGIFNYPDLFEVLFATQMDFDDASGTLYLARCCNPYEVDERMYTVDTATGLATEVGTLGLDSLGFGYYTAFAIANPTPPCTRAPDVPWLSVTPATGGIAVGAGAQDVQVDFDAAALAPGVYSADLCVFSNDPARYPASVPVRLTVE